MPASTLGTIKGRALLNNIGRKAGQAAAPSYAKFGTVSAISGEMIAVKSLDDTTEGAQLLFRSSHQKMTVGDLVALIPLEGGGYFAIRVGGNDAGLIQIDDANAFRVNNTAGEGFLRVSTSSEFVAVGYGGNFRGYSDGYSTRTFELAAGTGNAEFDGTVTIAALVAESANSPVARVSSAPNSNTANTTSTVTFQEMLSYSSLTLPTGTWRVEALLSGLFTHSAGGLIDMQLELDGSLVGSVMTQTAQTGAPGTRIYRSASLTSVSSGAHTWRIMFKSNAAGTTAADNPALLLIAHRES